MKYLAEVIIIAVITFSVYNFWIGLILAFFAILVFEAYNGVLDERITELDRENIELAQKIKSLEDRVEELEGRLV